MMCGFSIEAGVSVPLTIIRPLPSTSVSLERNTIAAVSPAFRPMIRRTTTPIAITAFVASRRVFFSLMKSAAIARTSSREKFPSPSRSYPRIIAVGPRTTLAGGFSTLVGLVSTATSSEFVACGSGPPLIIAVAPRAQPAGGSSMLAGLVSISTSPELVAGGSGPPPRPRDLSSIVLPEATPLSASVPYIGRLP